MNGRIFIPASLIAFLLTGSVCIAQSSPGTYVSGNHDFSFTHLSSYQREAMEEGDREVITLKDRKGIVVLMATFIPTATGAGLPLLELVQAHGIPSCSSTCTVSRTTALWFAPGIDAARYYYTEILPPREEGGAERKAGRGPLYAALLHPGSGDLLVFVPANATAESALLDILPTITPALSPRSPIAAPTPAEGTGSAFAPPLDLPLPVQPTDLPPAASTVVEEELLFGFINPQLTVAQTIALGLGALFAILLLFLRFKRKREYAKATAQLLQQ